MYIKNVKPAHYVAFYWMIRLFHRNSISKKIKLRQMPELYFVLQNYLFIVIRNSSLLRVPFRFCIKNFIASSVFISAR